MITFQNSEVYCMFPNKRLRRLRGSSSLRGLVRETQLSPDDFIFPMFITHGKNIKREISPMPGIFQFSVDLLEEEIIELLEIGIKGVLLFGIPSVKDELGTDAYSDNGIIQQAIKKIRSISQELIIISDICLCEYTDHGHCGVLEKSTVDNDKTLSLLSEMALSHVCAGSDMVAPSAMMDGQVKSIRSALDEAKMISTPIMSYSAKYASSFYGPFRVAAESEPQFGDRKNYQMDPGNIREAMLEISQDIEEGADIVMIKPALAFLDVIAKARNSFDLPIAAFNVSGEYSMLKAASQNNWINGQNVTIELLTGIKRSGADLIISYHSKEVVKWLNEKFS
jgi:porphobilinogen synthase